MVVGQTPERLQISIVLIGPTGLPPLQYALHIDHRIGVDSTQFGHSIQQR